MASLASAKKPLQAAVAMLRRTGRKVGIYPELKSPWFYHQHGKDLARAFRTVRNNTITAAKLAAGAIENARLLLLSNDVVTSGLGNQHDLVGRYFMDHPHIRRAMVVQRHSR